MLTNAKKITVLTPLVALLLSGCTGQELLGKSGVDPLYSFPVTSNETPYSQCIEDLAKVPGNNLPTFAVGEIDDKTGQVNYTANGHQLTQGVTEMVISALGKTGKANLVERSDLRIPLAEVKLAEQGRLSRPLSAYTGIPASDFIVMGALTELNYNIVSGGASLAIEGIGGGAKMVVINVALDLRVVNSRNFSVSYITSLQKQIYGYEVDANVFRFFGNTLVEFDAGKIKNEPLQLGVRSVVEMAVYQIMTDFLHLPSEQKCSLTQTDHMAKQLDRLATPSKGE